MSTSVYLCLHSLVSLPNSKVSQSVSQSVRAEGGGRRADFRLGRINITLTLGTCDNSESACMPATNEKPPLSSIHSLRAISLDLRSPKKSIGSFDLLTNNKGICVSDSLKSQSPLFVSFVRRSFVFRYHHGQ